MKALLSEDDEEAIVRTQRRVSGQEELTINRLIWRCFVSHSQKVILDVSIRLYPIYSRSNVIGNLFTKTMSIFDLPCMAVPAGLLTATPA